MSPLTRGGLTVVTYARLSFDDPNNRTALIEDRQTTARRYIEQQHGWVLVAEYADHGVTGATMQWPDLQRMLAVVRLGKMDIVVIEDVDRLGRDQEHLHYIAKIFRAHGVHLYAVAIGPVEDLVLAVKAIVADEQRRHIAYTTRRGLVEKARRSVATGSKTLSYRRIVVGIAEDGHEIDRYVMIDEEATVVQRIFELYAAGFSLKAINVTPFFIHPGLGHALIKAGA